MGNKYVNESREAQSRLRAEFLSIEEDKSCKRKRRYPTKRQAYQKKQKVYKCCYCGGWHRSGAFTKFVSQLKNIVAKKRSKAKSKKKKNKSIQRANKVVH